jgi:GNAT superfamily N-acetyltransferase
MSAAVCASVMAAVESEAAAASPRVTHDGNPGASALEVASQRMSMSPLYPPAAPAWRPPEGYRLRESQPNDDIVGHICGIYEEFGLGFDLDFEDDLVNVAASYAAGAFWVVEDAEGIVATGAVAAAGAARVIKRMYVAPRGRRAGLARGLLGHCLGWGEFACSELWSDVRFRSAHRLYLSEGFAPGPTRILDDPDRSVERYFRRAGGPAGAR